MRKGLEAHMTIRVMPSEFFAAFILVIGLYELSHQRTAAKKAPMGPNLPVWKGLING